MKHIITTLMFFISVLLVATSQAETEAPAISGRLEGGYRILTVSEAETPLAFKVYRGDYVKFEIPAARDGMRLVIPALNLEQRLPHRHEDARHITMRHSGVLRFKLDKRPGTITVIDFQQPNYRELTATQAADMIARFEPLILDVRTPREFQSGHLPNAVLLPVQTLQAHMGRLTPYREREILIYCATGNRSTVAAKILIDGGFTQIANLRHGIADWHRHDFPVVR